MVLSKWANYATTTWWTNRGYGTSTPVIDWDSTFANGQESNIRGAALTALSLTVPFRTGWDAAYSPVLGTARTKAAQLIVAVAQQHISNSPASWSWGQSWQSPLWAATCGMAALIGWDEMIPFSGNRQSVLNMLANEADYVLNNRSAEYWFLYIGSSYTQNPTRVGDSAAEEVSWCATVLWIAAALMPTHPSVGDWVDHAETLSKAAFSVESDNLAGFNLTDDYLVVNHNRVHPDYMTCVSQVAWGRIANGLVGLPMPTVSTFRIQEVWNALLTSPLDSVGTKAYDPTTPNVKFPQGIANDWGNRRPHAYVFLDELANQYFWRNIHCADAASMQARATSSSHPANAFVQSGLTPAEATYPEEEAYAASQIALSALVEHLKGRNQW